MPKYLLPFKCPNCGVTTVQEAEHRGEIEVFCGSCGTPDGQRFKFKISMSDAYEYNGYWRGICPNCKRHISSYIFSKQGIDYIFCGECSQLYPLEKAETFEVKDKEGRTAKEDKAKQEKWMVFKT